MEQAIIKEDTMKQVGYLDDAGPAYNTGHTPNYEGATEAGRSRMIYDGAMNH